MKVLIYTSMTGMQILTCTGDHRRLFLRIIQTAQLSRGGEAFNQVGSISISTDTVDVVMKSPFLANN